jgi:peptide deformylase
MKLVYYPDPRLREPAKKVGKADAALRDAVPEMFKIMYQARGIGLAGPQVGLGRRIVVANLEADPEKKESEQVFLDPEILDRAGDMKEEEGCLSLPGMVAQIKRSEKLTVRYRDLDGHEITRDVEGLEAKLFQHEIDHLDGILIVDKMGPADKKQWAGLLKELEEDFGAGKTPVRRARSAR